MQQYFISLLLGSTEVDGRTKTNFEEHDTKVREAPRLRPGPSVYLPSKLYL